MSKQKQEVESTRGLLQKTGANEIGRIKKDPLTAVVAIESDPTPDIKNVRSVKLVMKDGVVQQLR